MPAKPTTPQLALLKLAHRSGGALAPNTFAYYGVFAPHAGTEKIVDALRVAGRSHPDAAAVEALLHMLDRDELLAAGGLLDVGRLDPSADLAHHYVQAIRAGRVTLDGTPDTAWITPTTLAACIRRGWLTTKWCLTADGHDAGWSVEPDAFPADDACNEAEQPVNPTQPVNPPGTAKTDWVLAELGVTELIAGKVGSGKTTYPDPRVDAARDVLVPAGGRTRTYVIGDLDKAVLPLRMRMRPTQLDAASAAAAGLPQAMIGMGRARLSDAERDAVKQGISPQLLTRLSAPVTGDAVEALLPDLERIRDALLELLPAGEVRDQVAGDPRGEGYRMAVHYVRRRASKERTRTALMHFELALTRLATDRVLLATVSLTKARSVLGI